MNSTLNVIDGINRTKTMIETNIITDIIGVFGLLITTGVLINAFHFQGS